MIGNGNIKAVHTERLEYGDQYALALNYSLRQIAGEVPQTRIYAATLDIDNNGSTGSTLLMTVTLLRKDETGTAAASITYTLSGASTGSTAWSGSDAAGWTANASTLKEAIDLLNLIPNMTAYALNAPHSQSVNLDDFIDESTTYIDNQPDKYTSCLQIDVSGLATDAQYLRIGNPGPKDAGSWKLIDIFGTITSATAGVLSVYRDDIRDYEAGVVGERYIRETMATSSDGYLGDDILTAATYRGPLLVEVVATDTAGLDLTVKLVQAEL
ncbi:MAG: hypothetical protein EOM12_03345 [Verrucomicrobiae bacterium]|nr:hypothetical protein [Verrucomicrobiae bacterium]